jgi:hypothetical protein
MSRLAITLVVVSLSSGCAGYEDQLIVHRTRGKVWLEGKRVGRLVTEQAEPLTFTDCRVIDVAGEEGEGGDEVWRITTALRAGGDYRAECLGRRWMSVPFSVPK